MRQTSEYRAILWDMDGTLIDSEWLFFKSLCLSMADLGLQIKDSLATSIRGISAEDTYFLLCKSYDLKLTYSDWQMAAYKHYCNNAHKLCGFAKATDLWHELDNMGVKQAVVSNSDRLLVEINLQAGKIAKHGQVTVSRNDVRQGKPSPEGYLRAAWLLDVKVEQCLVIEDSSTGAEAGLAAGMTTCIIEHSGIHLPEDCKRITTDEIRKLFVKAM